MTDIRRVVSYDSVKSQAYFSLPISLPIRFIIGEDEGYIEVSISDYQRDRLVVRTFSNRGLSTMGVTPIASNTVEIFMAEVSK